MIVDVIVVVSHLLYMWLRGGGVVWVVIRVLEAWLERGTFIGGRVNVTVVELVGRAVLLGPHVINCDVGVGSRLLWKPS